MIDLNLQQTEAIEDILLWLTTSESYYLLEGAAGTGKTYTLAALSNEIKGRIVYTAPTNKATKVLRSTLTTSDYTPECCTIYSLLGLTMSANGEIKELKSPEDPIELKNVELIVIDEASMVSEQLMNEINIAVSTNKLHILFLGDPNQLPPVNEGKSKVWDLVPNKSTLYEVMRFDNQILDLAELIKTKVNHPAPCITFKNDNDKKEGIWYLPKDLFHDSIIRAARGGYFSNPEKLVKAIAWRNLTVNGLNQLIRGQIFDNADDQNWLPLDRIILTAPAADVNGKSIGHTDEEGVVESVDVLPHPIYSNILCYNLSVLTDENKRINLWTLHEEGVFEFRFQQTHLSNEAKMNGSLWKDFWEFSEAFHQVQHGYAITAHRAQGSTYESCFVVWNDILLNRNRQEAFRCLYVACTRPKRKLVLGSV